MSGASKIEWTDKVWNPVTGCDHVSPGCDNCYAERIATRFGRPFIGAVQCHPERLDLPLRWRKPRRVFVNSVSDLFHPDVPDDFIARVFAVMSIAESHTFQVLTKRPQRMAALLRSEVFRLTWFSYRDERAVEPDVQRMAARGGTSLALRWPLCNVWLGVSVESQRYADLRIPHLLATPAAVRFLSVEPLLGPVDLSAWVRTHDGTLLDKAKDTLDWVIVGGESGPNARLMDPEWPRLIRDQCTNAEVPFFFKQWGEWAPTRGYTDAEHRVLLARSVDGREMSRYGKRSAGRELDGRLWDEYPESI